MLEDKIALSGSSSTLKKSNCGASLEVDDESNGEDSR